MIVCPLQVRCCLRTPETWSDHPSSLPESHSSVLAPAAPDAAPTPSTSAPDLGAGAEDEGNTMADLRKDKDALHPSHENILVVPESPQSSLPLPVIGVAIVGPAGRYPDGEQTGDHPPQPLHGQDDIA